MLSLKRYGWLCVLGGEVAYFICILGGYLPIRTVRVTELHDALLETLPGFVWGSPLSVILGAVYVFMFAWIFGAYMVWMHNTNLIKRERNEATRSSPNRRQARFTLTENPVAPSPGRNTCFTAERVARTVTSIEAAP